MFKKLFSRTVFVRSEEEDTEYLQHMKENMFHIFQKRLVEHTELVLEKVKKQIYATDIFADINKKFDLQNIKNGSYEHQFIAHYEELEAFKKQVNKEKEADRGRIIEHLKQVHEKIQELENTVEENHSYAVAKIGLNAGKNKDLIAESKKEGERSNRIKLGMAVSRKVRGPDKKARRTWTKELQDRAISLRSYGFGYGSVAKKIGLSPATVRRHLIPLGK